MTGNRQRGRRRRRLGKRATAARPARLAGPAGEIADPAALRRDELAGLLGVAASTVTKWTGQGCPRRADGRYDLAAVARWVIEAGFGLHALGRPEAVELLGVAPPTLAAWCRRGCPRNADGTYSGPAVVAWVLRRQAADHRAELRAVLAGLGRVAHGCRWDVRRLAPAEIGELAGVTREAVIAWARNGCPRNPDGTFDLAAVAAWRYGPGPPAVVPDGRPPGGRRRGGAEEGNADGAV